MYILHSSKMIQLLKKILIFGLLSAEVPVGFSYVNYENSAESGESSSECGGKFSLETSARLEVPNLTEPSNCTWKIQSPWQTRIAIFFDSFDIDDQNNCTDNFVSIHDGHSDRDGLMGVFCGKNKPPNLRSYDNGITVKLVTNNAMSRFSAVVLAVFDECLQSQEESSIKDYNLHGSWNFENPCGKTFEPTETTGIIQSPCYPKYYPRNKNCVWNIIAPPEAKIRLNFTTFILNVQDKFHGDEICTNSAVNVISMDGENQVMNHGFFCGFYIPEPIISIGNSLRVIFRSSSLYNVDYFGFEAEFSHQFDQ